MTIFRGEVARACGGLAGGTEAYGDTVLFTEQEDVLEMVAAFDQTYQVRRFLGEILEVLKHNILGIICQLCANVIILVSIRLRYKITVRDLLYR